MKLKQKIKDFFKIKNFVTLSIFVFSIFYLFVVCRDSFYRFCCSVKDLCKSFCFWFLDIFSKLWGFSSPSASGITVNNLPDVDIQKYIPINIDEFLYRVSRLDSYLLDSDNYARFNVELFFLLYRIFTFALLFVFCSICVEVLLTDFLCSENEKENGDLSKGYVKIQKIFYKRIKPAFIAVKNYVLYFVDLPGAVFCFCLIWLLSFNILSIFIDFFAYYFYFLATFDFFSLLVQLYKLALDIAIMLNAVPLWAWILIVGVVYCVIAIYVGLDRLRHGEAKNCGVVKLLNLLILIVGAMGLGKTALATDIALSLNNIQKTEAQQIMFKYDMLFPQFSWELFEKDLQREISAKRIYNIPSVKKYVDMLERSQNAFPGIFAIEYKYDTKMSLTKDIGTFEISLFDAMYEYGKAYFVYTCDNPNLANYSIRLDGYHDDSPFFKKWCGDFFRPDKSKSKFCHILDQDIMRLGKLVDVENKYAGSFGFGIYNNTEWGKSRLNQVNLEGVKKDAEETNQKNDLYDYLIKLVRHASVMIDNKVFFRFIGDEQRPESIPASLRDVVTVVQIVSKSEIKNSLPGFFIMDKIYDSVYEPIKDIYYSYRNKRGDRTAVTFILKGIVSAFSNFYLKAYNNFGYYDLELETESGRAFGNRGESLNGATRYTYQLAVKKIYSERYSTDCYQQFFEKRQLDSQFGINDYPCYAGLKMTVEEMQQQHDYFLMEIMDIMLGEKESPERDSLKKTKNKTKEKTNSFEGLVFESI